MADTKIPDLTGLGTVASGDELYIVDKSDTTDGVDGTSTKVTANTLATYQDARTATFTNKTLTSPAINAPVVVQSSTTYTPAGAGTATLDLSVSNLHKITMPAGNITIALSNETTNQCFMVEITQDSGGSRTVTWFTTIKWPGGTAPTLTTTANKRDTFGFRVTASGTYDAFIMGQNL